MKRTEEEKSGIWSIMVDAIKEETDDLVQGGVSIKFLGDQSLFPDLLCKKIEHVEKKTSEGQKLHVQAMFFYGGQQEIVHVVKSLADKVKEGKILSDDITLDTVKESLWTADIPDPEIVIRSGGFSRMSNFLTFQTAYSELFFLDVLWPDFNESHLNDCVKKFDIIQRNFGQ